MAPDHEFRQVWLGDAADLHLLSQARHGLGLAVAALALRLGRPPVLWLPGYYCDSALGPARQAGARLRFYPVAASLDPDWAACAEAARLAPPDLFVLVHTGGRPADLRGARAFCHAQHALLVEDASQVLWPACGIGSSGDLVLFSPRKYLAVPDGAVLVVRREADAALLRETAAALSPARPPVFGWLVRQMRRRLRALTRRRPERPSPLAAIGFDATGPVPPTAPELWMSCFSRWRIASAIRSGGLARVAAARLALHRSLLRALLARPQLSEVGACEEAIPVSTLVRADSEATAMREMTALRALGAQVQPWPDQPREPDDDPVAHAGTLALRRTLLWALHEPRQGLPADAFASGMALPTPARAVTEPS